MNRQRGLRGTRLWNPSAVVLAEPDGSGVQVQTVAEAHLGGHAGRTAQAFLREQFASWGAEDWRHCLGGLHVLAWEDGRLIGHGALVPRRLRQGGRSLRAGYVEGLAVARAHRGRGLGGRLMAVLEAAADERYEIAALSTTDAAAPFYSGRGWLAWQGPTAVERDGEVQRSPDDDGGVFVRPGTAVVDLAGELICDWRDGDVW